MKKDEIIKIKVVKGTALGVPVYRGFANICELSQISKADIYDIKNNPYGTQRDLNKAHAKQAYEYVKNHDVAFWPEVFLCIRDNDVIKYYPLTQDNDFGYIEINKTKINRSKKICISRVDGNHRLHYSDGSDPKFLPIKKEVSFCISYDLTRDEEITLFKDINDNQKSMDTSHLDNIKTRLTDIKTLKTLDPALYIAQELAHDKKSPFYQRVYEGGKKLVGFDMPLRALKTGIDYLLSHSRELAAIKEPEAKYRIIFRYFNAVKKWQPDAWKQPKKYITLRGAGFWAICFIGAYIIDKGIISGKIEIDNMVTVLKSGNEWNWSNHGDFKGFSGRGGAKEISEKVTGEFHDEKKITTKEIVAQLMKDD